MNDVNVTAWLADFDIDWPWVVEAIGVLHASEGSDRIGACRAPSPPGESQPAIDYAAGSGFNDTKADEQVLTAELAVPHMFGIAFAGGRLNVEVLLLGECWSGGIGARPLRSHGHLPQPISLKPERMLVLEERGRPSAVVAVPAAAFNADFGIVVTIHRVTIQIQWAVGAELVEPSPKRRCVRLLDQDAFDSSIGPGDPLDSDPGHGDRAQPTHRALDRRNDLRRGFID